jgi:hypothetical protein
MVSVVVGVILFGKYSTVIDTYIFYGVVGILLGNILIMVSINKYDEDNNNSKKTLKQIEDNIVGRINDYALPSNEDINNLNNAIGRLNKTIDKI